MSTRGVFILCITILLCFTVYMCTEDDKNRYHVVLGQTANGSELFVFDKKTQSINLCDGKDCRMLHPKGGYMSMQPARAQWPASYRAQPYLANARGTAYREPASSLDQPDFAPEGMEPMMTCDRKSNTCQLTNAVNAPQAVAPVPVTTPEATPAATMQAQAEPIYASADVGGVAY